MENEMMVNVREENMSVKEWLVTLLLMSIPVVNLVLMVIWAIGTNEKESKKNYFRAYWIYTGIVTAIMFVIFMAMTMLGISLSSRDTESSHTQRVTTEAQTTSTTVVETDMDAPQKEITTDNTDDNVEPDTFNTNTESSDVSQEEASYDGYDGDIINVGGAQVKILAPDMFVKDTYSESGIRFTYEDSENNSCDLNINDSYVDVGDMDGMRSSIYLDKDVDVKTTTLSNGDVVYYDYTQDGDILTMYAFLDVGGSTYLSTEIYCVGTVFNSVEDAINHCVPIF